MIVSLSWLVPLVGALLLLVIDNSDGRRNHVIRWLALLVSLAAFVTTLALWVWFDPASPEFQFVERHAWIPAFGIDYYVGVDGVSLLLVVLTAFLTPIALLSGWHSIERKVKEFVIFMLALEAAMIGVFVSLDLFLFYVFWDAMLVPMYFLIGIWGYDQRIYAAIKFMLYTMAGSMLMLIAILGLAYLHSAATGSYSFDLLKLYALEIAPETQVWFFLAFTVAFAIKVPLFPFHTWLPDAHVQAPTGGSVILAGVLLKMGTYGLVRFAFPLFPVAAAYFAPWLALLAVVGIIYGALVAMVQPDMKKLVAYSSVSHLGFVVLGICAMNIQGVQGALYQMLAHGVSTGGLFLLVGMLSDRRHTRLIAEFGGLKGVMPRLTAAFMIITLASIGLPGLNGFIGEFLIMLGTFRWDPRYVVGAGLGVILSAVYMLWMFQRVYYGRVTHPENATLPDLQRHEWASVVPVCAIAVVMGVFPTLFLRPTEPAVAKVVDRMVSTQNLRVQNQSFGTFRMVSMLSSIAAIVPMLCVVLAALTVMGAEAFRDRDEKMPIGGLGVVGLIGAAVSAVLLWSRNSTGFGVVVADHFGLFVTLVLVAVGLLTIMFSSQVVERDALPAGDYYALVLFSIAGMMMMATANDLLVIFIALEILSLGVYVLTGIRRDDHRATEAAFKYFLLGAFSSAFFLYGIAFTYGMTGSTRLDRIGSFLAAQSVPSSPMILIGLGLLLVGFAFKISAVPFHMWTPDAYEGAPAIVTGFMSTGVKAAAFAALTRVFLSTFEPLSATWVPLIWGLAAATMILGTVVGVAQSNLKRMLAYSSIAHGGYLLVGLVAANQVGKAAILFYLLAYAITNLAAFGVIALLGTRERANDELRDYAGLWQTHPALAALMTVCLLSLGGLPPTAGFIGKWYIFSAAVGAGYYGLAVIGVLTSVVSVFFYLRVVVMMYMADREGATAAPRVSVAGIAALTLSIIAIFYLGILPAPVLNLAADSIATIF